MTRITTIFARIIAALLLLMLPAHARLASNIRENYKLYGKELYSREFDNGHITFSGRKVYQLSYLNWQVDTLYKNGRSYSEAARPKGNSVTKKIITEEEANVIADMLFPKKDRGNYRKQIKNANFISHFFDSGVVSYEMQLDSRGINHIGISGVRTVLYSDGANYDQIRVNAYQ